MPKTYKKIGVLKLAAIGDTVLIAHCLHSMKRKYPEAEIVFFSGKTNAEMATFLPVDKVKNLSVFSPLQAIRSLRRENLSVLIDCESWLRLSAIFAYFSKAKYTIGFQTKGQYKHFAFDLPQLHHFDRHEQENFAALFRSFGMGQLTTCSFVKTTPPEPLLVLHLFAGGTHAFLKQWPKAYWRKLLSLLRPLHFDIYTTGSRKDCSQIDEVFQGFPIKNVAGKFSLSETIRLLQRAQCVVSVDTGIMHIAGALNIPTLCLHGPTNPKRWGAIGKNVHTFFKNPSPCIHLGFEKPCDLCKSSMTQILPEEVFKEIEGIFCRTRKELRNQKRAMTGI